MQNCQGDLEYHYQTTDIVIQRATHENFTAINIGEKTKQSFVKHWVGIHSKSNYFGSWYLRFIHHVGSCFLPMLLWLCASLSELNYSE
jgi:hypothetical protein